MEYPGKMASPSLVRNRPPAGASREDELPDTELAEGVRRGDGSVAATLYARLLPTAERTLLRVLGRRTQDLPDLVQQTFERLVRTLVENRWDGSVPLRAWVSVLAARVGVDALRAQYRRRHLFDVREVPDAPHDEEGRLGARAELERVRRTLALLSPERVEVLVLHDVLGHELAEIAGQLGISVAAAQSRLVRGRRQLIARLNSEEPLP